MENELLLDILRSQDMRGCRLVEFIDNSLGSCVGVKKPIAWYLHNRLQAYSWMIS